MAVTNECFRQILSSTDFLKFENVLHFVKAGAVTLAELAEGLGVSEEVGKMFLINNAHLVEVSFDAQRNIDTSSVPMYYTTDKLSKFLESASHGGVFHIEFRKKFIRISQAALAFLNTPQDLSLPSGVNM